MKEQIRSKFQSMISHVEDIDVKAAIYLLFQTNKVLSVYIRVTGKSMEAVKGS